MKKYILLSFTVIFAVSCHSQQIVSFDTPFEDFPNNNYYHKDIENYNDQLVGVWRWENGNEIFELTLVEFEAQQDFLSSDIYRGLMFYVYAFAKADFF